MGERIERFGRYELVERLGQGGMAEVWKAKIRGVGTFERTLVIKRILPQLARDEELVAMFMREAQVCSMLSHRNIVQVHELGELGGEYYLAMEYVHGRDLHAIIKAKPKTPPPPGFACVVARDVCRALSYAYNTLDERGRPLHIIHRDVTPSNVMVTVDGTVKLVDFGVAKALSSSSSNLTNVLGSLRGKLGYAAPEQLKGGKVDHRTDLFAVGVLTHELLTGRQLFRGDDDRELIERVLDGPIYPPSKINAAVPPGLDAIVMRALERDPARRFQDGSEMATELVPFVHGLAWGPAKLAELLLERFPEIDRARTWDEIDDTEDTTPPEAMATTRDLEELVPPPRPSLRPTASFVRVAADMGAWSSSVTPTVPRPDESASATVRRKPVRTDEKQVRTDEKHARTVEKPIRPVAAPAQPRAPLQGAATSIEKPRSQKSAAPPAKAKQRDVKGYVLLGAGIVAAAASAFVLGQTMSGHGEPPANAAASIAPTIAPPAPPPSTTSPPPAQLAPPSAAPPSTHHAAHAETAPVGDLSATPLFNPPPPAQPQTGREPYDVVPGHKPHHAHARPTSAPPSSSENADDFASPFVEKK